MCQLSLRKAIVSLQNDFEVVEVGTASTYVGNEKFLFFVLEETCFVPYVGYGETRNKSYCIEQEDAGGSAG